MGFVNGQDTNALLSKRLKKITAEHQPVVKKQEPKSVVAKIERVLFAYRETLAYYQDMLEKFEERYYKNATTSAPDHALVTPDYEYEKLSEQLKVCIGELEEKMRIFEETGAKQLDAYKEAGANQLNAIDNLLHQVKGISEQQERDPALEDISVSMNPMPSEEEGEEEQEDDYLVQMEVYNKNLTEIKKRLDELMRFVGKLDGSIIENLKSHTNENRDTIIQQLNEMRTITENRSHGIKPLLIFNLIFGILNVGGITFLILEYLGLINL